MWLGSLCDCLSFSLQVGDFGLINKNTGQFEKAGNIYTHPDTAELVKGFPAETKVADEKHILISRGKRINGAQVGGASVTPTRFHELR